MTKKPIFERMLGVDRKWLYALMFLAVLVPFILKMTYNTYETPEVTSIYTEIEKIYEHNKNNPEDIRAIWVAMDYSPGTNAELDPMAAAVLRHAFLRKIPVISWTGLQDNITLAERLLNTIAKDYAAVYGVDYVFLGWPYPWLQAVIGCSSNIRGYFQVDHYGNDTKKMPIFDKIPNFGKVDLVTTISGTAYPRSYVVYVNGLFGKKIATGSTAVSAAEFYPYLQTGQMVGLMGGLKGAAEYEQMSERLEKSIVGDDIRAYLTNLYEGKDKTLYDEKYFAPSFNDAQLNASIERRYQARRGMAPQASAHFLIIGLIIVGNICFFMKRKYDEKV